MPSCPNGHQQRLGLKCTTCGAELTYRDSLGEACDLPKVEPDYGKVSVLSVGFPGIRFNADYIAGLVAEASDLETPALFQVANIRGGSWIDFQRKYVEALRNWMTLMGLDKSAEKFLLVDTTNQLSVLALSAFPHLKHSAVIAVLADQSSTPIEQNTSYVALSLAFKKGLPIIALSKSYANEMLFFTKDRGFATRGDAVSTLLDSLLGSADDLLDMMERDLKLGIKMHCISIIISGSKNIYGNAANAFNALSYNISVRTEIENYQTLHSLVYSQKEMEGDFEKGFGVYRNKRFKGALSAEFRYRQTTSPLYDMLMLYGLKGDESLRTLAGGYQEIVKTMPELKAEDAVQ
ncbi:MAG: hypothetical protein OK455_08650 [Thaumarchaeota archaeon]|nr:hypothetical protein [Nitrososphaerota archaeon]